MSTVRKLAATLAVVLPTVFTLAVSAPAAHADRCQPEELQPIALDGIIPEHANPVCLVTDEVVYPLLGCPQPTTLMGCQTSIGTITANAPNAPGYALNAVFKAPGTAVNFVGFVQNRDFICITYDFTGRQLCIGGYGVDPG